MFKMQDDERFDEEPFDDEDDIEQRHNDDLEPIGITILLRSLHNLQNKHD